MTKIAHAELPRITRASRVSLDAKIIKEAVNDLDGSFDFAPHAYTDGEKYPDYSKALSAANLTIREVAAAMGKPSNMYRRRVWHGNGNKDRKAKGPWLFAVSQRSTPPKPRAPRATSSEATA